MNYKNLYWLWLSVIVVIADQTSKWFATTHLLAWVQKPVLPFLNLCLSFNRGAAFGFLHAAAGWQRWFFVTVGVLICVSILVWLCRLPKQEKLICTALVLIFGGALGNLWDRLLLGYVVDFIQLHLGQWYFPTFNLADSAISVGATLVLFTFNRRTFKSLSKI
jgi:signal peptidase II